MWSIYLVPKKKRKTKPVSTRRQKNFALKLLPKKIVPLYGERFKQWSTK